MADSAKQRKHFSFECFPPRDDTAHKKFLAVSKKLSALKPDFFSVTFGAGGGNRTRTLETVLALSKHTRIKSIPHLSCVSHDETEIAEILQHYKTEGLDHLVAIRGDLPSGLAGYGKLRYANELVEFIRKHTGDYFRIEVAAYPEFHPQTCSANADIDNFKRKVDAGADGAITQYFYSSRAYYHFVNACQQKGVTIPIVAGIMPIINRDRLIQFSQACGAEIPLWLKKRLYDFGDDTASLQAFGVEVVTQLCEDLLKNDVPGLHFFTLNQSVAVTQIWQNLRLIE